MSTDQLEKQRLKYEELEVIEKNITERIQRNPQVFYANYQEYLKIAGCNNIRLKSLIAKENISSNRIYKWKRRIRKRKQTLIQQHEINDFLKRVLQLCNEIEDTANETDLKKEVQKNYSIEENTDELDLDKFDLLLKSINSTYDKHDPSDNGDDFNREYKMFPTNHFNRSKNNTSLLSLKAMDLNLNKIFTRDEHYGDFLNLDSFYNDWLNVMEDASVTFLEFFVATLELFEATDFAYLFESKINRDSEKYKDFIVKLTNKLTCDFRKIYPLIDYDIFESDVVNKSFPHIISAGIKHKVSSTGRTTQNEEEQIFCICCDKFFKNDEKNYVKHLDDTEHLENYKNKGEFLKSEYKLHWICSKLLNDVINRTKSFHERKLAFTAKERSKELQKLTKEYDEPIYTPEEYKQDKRDETLQKKLFRASFNNDNDSSNSEDEEDQKLLNLYNMPLGTDGLPIPKWLYKLQKLDVEYPCEICGNVQYRGYKNYNKHFSEPKHIFGLKCLGVSSNPIVFKGISTIKEVKHLKEELENSGTGVAAAAAAAATTTTTKSANGYKNVTGDVDNKWVIEVEDKNGNVIPASSLLKKK
ncbi:SF3a splicing factor complex subunit PRP9 SCDLUD_002550 [Saccharomycodes ludwigii]|uniref:SF3a splicing factor complex subunit PRP9 n=1 Tax=Saccharomycodes ludwigii TaxID=36035 RepID=UPI001E8C49E6|nr:hypothetical protein SCDLUD_002550 [Saccharomycodes ludwigii]KAH3901075.1 hypothetical protein SCDLUD_002550 [Saccharomycodes ludwigii]